MRVPLNWLKEYIDTQLSAQEVADRLTMVGHALDKPIYTQADDLIMDFEDRGNRADVLGLIGLARDLAGLTNQEIKLPKRAEIPEIDNDKFSPKITVHSDRVIRWKAVVFKDIKIGPSPRWLQERLRSYGIEMVNNLVDITNYVMVETGMPLHAFDLDKIDEINLRMAKIGETLITFEGTELKLDGNDLIATDGQKPLTLTTAIGGRESGISDSTEKTLIEAGLYDQPTTRRSAIKHNVINESSNRLGKYLHPQFCELAIARTVELIKEVLNANPENISYDYYPNPPTATVISLSRKRLNLIAGSPSNLERASEILRKLEFSVKEENKDLIRVEVPYFRTDVKMEDDLVEEVLRIEGLDKIEAQLLEKPAPTRLFFPEMDLEDQARDILAKLGFNEVISQQIVDIRDVRKTHLLNENKVVKLENSWNEELNILRPEFVSPQLKYVSSYAKHRVDPIMIFEIGKTYSKENDQGYDGYKEKRKIAITISSGFNNLKANLLRLLSELGIKQARFEKLVFPVFRHEHAAAIKIEELEIGKIGEVRKDVLDSFGVKLEICHAVLYPQELLKCVEKSLTNISTKVPNLVSEDFTLIVNEHEEIASILEKISNQLRPKDKVSFLGVYNDGKMKKSGKKAVSFNVKFTHENLGEIKRLGEEIKRLSI